ncbi:hypothetical protein G7Z98_09250 [Pseudomonas stutzeri]|nr:hypothetical protein [Stutzerimonas stutzeri]
MSKVLVDREWLKQLHRDLDACQKVIWSGLRGADPAYCQDAQVRLKEIDELLAQPAQVEVARDYRAEFAEGDIEARTAIDELSDALSAVTAERDAANSRLHEVAVACATAEQERDQLRAEVEELRVLLIKSLPIVEAHAGASHMLEGFRPTRNQWDELVDEVRAAMAAKEG